MASHTVPDDLAGERTDKIVAVLGGLSRSEARTLVDDGAVTSDGLPVSARDRLESGAVVEFEVPEPGDILQPEEVDLVIRYEDEHLLVVEKPAGMVVHPGAGRNVGTLAAGLLYRYPTIRGVGEDPRWGIVHRLDRDTSGLLVVALTAEAHELLAGMIKRRLVHRGYTALVDGTFDAPRGTIDAPVGPDPSRPKRRVVSPFGKPARTHYRRTAQWSGWEVSMLDVTLETGRTHQIRVHMTSIGHPVIGDRWYGKPTRVDSPRVFLHAGELSFEHPITGDEVRVSSPLAPDLTEVLARLGPAD